MISISNVLRLGQFIANAFTSTGLRQEILMRYGMIYALLLLTQNGPAPPIFSARRTIAEQAALYQEWKRGEITNRPARFSWHTEGAAIDVLSSVKNFNLFKDLWIMFGGRWGGNFLSPDISHFDYPITGIKPKPAY